ncbi:MAG: HAD-IIIC family phosphatase [Caulobacteraceae bacterium]|nr:HAD-IIIC family phosphatase [Caulobacter sp.]
MDSTPRRGRLRRRVARRLLAAVRALDPAADLSGRVHVERRVFTPHPLGPPLSGLRYLLVGLCQLGVLADGELPLGAEAEHVLFDPSSGAEPPSPPLERFDAAVVSLTLRHLLNAARPDAPDLLFARGFADEAEALAALDRVAALVADQLGRLRAALGDLPVFVFDLLEPSFPYLGRLLPDDAVTEPAGFTRRLNARLARAAAALPGVHVFPLNRALDTVGRLHLQDDVLADFAHGGLIGGGHEDLDAERLVPAAPVHEVFDIAAAQPLLRSFVFRELADAVKTLRGTGRVKLIVVDLDDTLWRGVAADSEMEGWRRTEGWPLGFAEALLVYRRRGGLLAICSRNEEAPTRARFAAIWGARLRLEDFASVRIGWRSKAEAVAEILAECAVLPEHALFVDDNPRELSEVAAALPGLRVLGGSHRDWRRVILRSPETQVEALTGEARRRTELVRTRAARAAEGAAAPDRAAWLRVLEMQAAVAPVEGRRDPAFPRALELLNKTNQFNTTGRRWSQPELERFGREGGRLLALSLRDRLVDNGLVGLALVRPGEIVQLVLSCRVFGLGAETVLAGAAVAEGLRGATSVRAEVVETGRNLACLGCFAALGFTAEAGGWRTTAAPATPDWITLSVDRRVAAPR